MKRTSFLLAVLGLALSACTVTVDEGNPPPRPRPPRPDVCPQIYQPVCATRFGERDTFPNACVAETRGYDILYGGECRSQPQRPPLPARPPRPPISEPVACPLIEAPVCARQGRIVRTFANACIAEGSGFRVIDNGPC